MPLRVVGSEFPMKPAPLGKHDAPKLLRLYCTSTLSLTPFFFPSVFRDLVKYVESRPQRPLELKNK